MIDREEFFKGYLDAILFTESIGDRIAELHEQAAEARRLGRVPERQLNELASMEGIAEDTSLLSYGCERDDFTEEAQFTLRLDCDEFVRSNYGDLAEYVELRGDVKCAPDSFGRTEYSASECAGSDFWLSRNGHGAGYFDRGQEPVFRRLQEAARVYGEASVYFDGERIHAN